MPITIDCFKAYDVRGQIPNQLNAEVCYRIGNATAAFLDAETVVVGRDMRLSSAEFSDAVVRGLTEAGADVLDIGLCGTEMVYFATSFLNASGGIMVTASHNPADYNGLKFVREEARPISADTGLADIRRLAVDLRRLHQPHALLRGRRKAEAADTGRQRRQRLRRNRGGRSRAAPAVRIHQGVPRTGRYVPERHPESAAAREPCCHHRRRQGE
jgi:phosphomannomutase